MSFPRSLFLKSSLCINALGTMQCLYLFKSGSSALIGHPGCGLYIWLSLLTILNTLFWVYANYFSWENGQNMKILKVCHFCMNGKWLPRVTRHAKHKQDYYLSTILFQLLQSMNYSFFVGLIHVSLWHLLVRKDLVSNNTSPCHRCSSSQRAQYWP